MTKLAVIDDWQSVASTSADWPALCRGTDVTFFADAFASEDDAASKMAEFDIVLSIRERTPFPASLIARLPHLRMLAITGARNASLDIEACNAAGLVVCNTTGSPSSRSAPAELALGLLLSVARAIPPPTPVFGPDASSTAYPSASRSWGRRSGLSDSAVAAVRDDRIFAGVNVFDREPLPIGDRMRGLPHTVVTPHLGYCVAETLHHFYAQSVEKAMAFLDGKPVRVMNPEVLARSPSPTAESAV